jgi:hypothetical protein
VLSILPTLSREYDQHFKSFSNVPAKFGPGKKDKAKSKGKGEGNGDSDKAVSESTNVNEKGGTEEEDAPASEAEAENGEGGENGGENSDDEDGPVQTRGSRCFEVLGIDVMVDSKLRPTLIEFNHLPRY